MDLCPLHPRFYRTEKTPCPECTRLAALKDDPAQIAYEAIRQRATDHHRAFHDNIAKKNLIKLHDLRERCASLQLRLGVMTGVCLVGWLTVVGLCIKDYMK